MSEDTQSAVYDGQTADFIAAVAKNLPRLSRSAMQHYIEKPKLLQQGLRILDHPLLTLGTNIADTFQPIEVWRRFVIDSRSPEMLCECISQQYQPDYDCEFIMQHESSVVLPHGLEVDVALVTPWMLGFSQEVKLLTLLARAKECGLTWHPALAAHVCVNYHDMPVGEEIFFPMDPIPDSRGRPSILAVDVSVTDGNRYIWAAPGEIGEDWGYENSILDKTWMLDEKLAFIMNGKAL